MLDPVEDQAGPRELQGVKSGMEGGWVGWADGLTVQGEMLERSHAERHGESSGFEWCRVESRRARITQSRSHAACVCPLPVASCPLPGVGCPVNLLPLLPVRVVTDSSRPEQTNADPRQVDLSCGTTNALLSVSEPEKCEYRFKVTSPALCYPVEEAGGASSGAAGVKAEL
jgi:hypothetical protein